MKNKYYTYTKSTETIDNLSNNIQGWLNTIGNASQDLIFLNLLSGKHLWAKNRFYNFSPLVYMTEEEHKAYIEDNSEVTNQILPILSPTKGGYHTLSLRFDNSVESIIIDNIIYEKDIDIRVPHNTMITYRINLKSGYEVDMRYRSYGYLAINKDIVMAPSSVPMQIPIWIGMDNGVNNVLYKIYRNDSYKHDGLKSGMLTSRERFDLRYGDIIEWSAMPNFGYTLQQSSGTFIVTGESTDLYISTMAIACRMSVRATAHLESISYSINGSGSYTLIPGNTVQINYGSRINWKAIMYEGYKASPDSGEVYVYSDITVGPTREYVDTYSLEFSFDNHVALWSLKTNTDGLLVLISPTNNIYAVNQGTNYIITPIPETGYTITNPSGSITYTCPDDWNGSNVLTVRAISSAIKKCSLTIMSDIDTRIYVNNILYSSTTLYNYNTNISITVFDPDATISKNNFAITENTVVTITKDVVTNTLRFIQHDSIDYYKITSPTRQVSEPIINGTYTISGVVGAQYTIKAYAKLGYTIQIDTLIHKITKTTATTNILLYGTPNIYTLTVNIGEGISRYSMSTDSKSYTNTTKTFDIEYNTSVTIQPQVLIGFSCAPMTFNMPYNNYTVNLVGTRKEYAVQLKLNNNVSSVSYIICAPGSYPIVGSQGTKITTTTNIQVPYEYVVHILSVECPSSYIADDYPVRSVITNLTTINFTASLRQSGQLTPIVLLTITVLYKRDSSGMYHYRLRSAQLDVAMTQGISGQILVGNNVLANITIPANTRLVNYENFSSTFSVPEYQAVTYAGFTTSSAYRLSVKIDTLQEA